MDHIDKIFNYYDTIIANVPVGWQAVISFAVLLFLIWNIYYLFKSGHWVFILLLIVLLPGTWPAAKKLGLIFWHIIESLLFRIQAF